MTSFFCFMTASQNPRDVTILPQGCLGPQLSSWSRLYSRFPNKTQEYLGVCMYVKQTLLWWLVNYKEYWVQKGWPPA